MKVTVKLFAAARDLAGGDQLAVELPGGATIGELRKRLRQECPSLGPLLAHAMFAVDATYVSDDAPISPHAEIACIPPVSGG
jgi:molybdopterin converting factor subunit 1